MAAPITGLGIPQQIPLTPQIGQTAAPSATDSFRSMLTSSITSVEQQRATAHTSIEKFLAGDNEELHQTVMEVQKAQLSFDLFLQMRNKVVAAYQEVMRMQL